MKKTYQKPQIMFESFSLTTTIASGCEKIITTSAKDICGEKVAKGSYLFFTGIDQCNVIPAQEGTVDSSKGYDGVCYHNPTVNNNIYTS